MNDEQLLAEVEELRRTMPPMDSLHQETEANYEWLGRLLATVRFWNFSEAISLEYVISGLSSPLPQDRKQARHKIQLTLSKVHSSLRLKTVGPVNIAVGQGNVFHYFDELRKIIELAKSDLFFIDPYLDADFVTRYLPHVTSGVSIRLLTSHKLATLTPAVELFSQEKGMKIQVRSAKELHDRYVIVDSSNCYHSGASFKDGAKTASTILTQITDAFIAVQKTYEDLWTSGKVHR